MKPTANQIICGSNIDVVKPWPANCIDGICTDPPYGLGFMDKEWDTFTPENVNKSKTTKLTYKTDYINGVPVKRNKPEIVTRDSGARRAGSYDLSRNSEFQQWFTVWAKAMLRITKPGGFLLCFGGTRTFHRLTCAIEDAGWEIRDCMMWLYGSGFPKSHNISKAIDKAAGAKRKQIETPMGPTGNKYAKGLGDDRPWMQKAAKTGFHTHDSDIPATILAQLWSGYGTALKPAWEPIIVAMKPLDGTFAHNAERHGVAGLNIDDGRIEGLAKSFHDKGRKASGTTLDWSKTDRKPRDYDGSQGRWPANLVLDEEVAEGESWKRYFYCAKTSRKERNMGMEDCDDKLLARSGGAQGAENRGEKEYLQKHIGLNRVAVVKNNHPTVKPLALMKYLCTLLKMPSADQIILDPFIGSGTTGMACASLGIGFIGIEKELEYCEISAKRISAITGKPLPVTKNVETFRATKDFAGGSRRPPSPQKNENLPHISEHRQSIINAASAALKNRKNP